MKKRIIIILSIIFCTFFCLSCVETKNETIILDGIRYRLNESEEEPYYSASAADITITTAQIANNINGYPVKCLTDHAFSNCEFLKTINLPNSIKHIGKYAFYNCDSLKHISLPNSIEEINYNCFKYCSSLESIDMPDNLKTINIEAFEGCIKLKKVELPEGVTEIREKAFIHCNALEEIKMPETMTYIGKMAFMECNNLKQIIIPNGITFIDHHSFYNCNLNLVYIPKSVKRINESAFGFHGKYNCPKVYYEGTQSEWETILIEEGNKTKLQINSLTFESARP